MTGFHEYTGTLFKSGGSQAIRIPKECRFPKDIREVSIFDDGDKMIIRRKKKSLLNFFEKFKDRDIADFLEDRNDLPPEERDLF